MFIGILTLLTALSISAVAIYYSVAGLMTIFAAAALPIMIMGGVLEIGKLVTAVWLHRYWHEAAWWLKTYLVTAVVVLMFITSMGIFGFLSRAHIEQTASAADGVAQIERIDAEIARNETVVSRAEQRIVELESTGSSVTNQLQQQIDLEQQRINTAYDRIQPAIDEQNAIIADQTALFEQELAKIDQELERLRNFINNDEIERAQAIVGTEVDGDYGPATARSFQSFQDAKAQEREQWLTRIQQAQQNDVVRAAREEIRRLRSEVDQQIAASNNLINNLREQLQNNDANSLQSLLEEQNQRILTAQAEIDQLLDRKFELEAEYRKLEAEVGPVKYIAEFVYGDSADKDTLEEAVRWVIVIIIFVFDPLAVLLLIASQFTFEHHRKLRQEKKVYEQHRADVFVANKEDQVDTGQQGQDTITSTLSTGVGAEQKGRDYTQRMAVAQQGEVDDGSMEEANTDADTTVRDMVSEDRIPRDAVAEQRVEQDQIQPDELAQQVAESFVEKKDQDIESQEESGQERERRIAYETKEQDATFVLGKTQWKDANPDKTLKHYKHLYIKGLIDHLPWEESGQGDNYKEEGYRQNGEQSERTLFNKLQRRNND